MSKRDPRKNGRFIDLAGHAFGMLSVVSLADSRNGKAFWNCECTCGNLTQVAGNSLRTGNTKSCGCTRMENLHVAARIATTKHGMYGTPTYSVWQGMLARCDKPSHKSYKDYGGKGITVCSRWRSFEPFLEDMGIRPSGLTIDRIDGSGNYEPGNCRWATAKTQANNRHNNRLNTYQGETKTTTQWAEDPRCVVSFVTFAKRIDCGWPIEHALTAPYRSVLKTLLKRGGA